MRVPVRPDRERASRCRRASADSSRMADLHCSIAADESTRAAPCKAMQENSDEDALDDSIRGEKFSAVALAENAIRSGSTQIRRDQYTSCWNRPFFLSSATKLIA